MRIFLASQKGTWALIKLRFDLFIEWLTPLNKELKRIGNNYDKSIEGYFAFFRFLVLMSFFVGVLYATLLILHLINNTFGYS